MSNFLTSDWLSACDHDAAAERSVAVDVRCVFPHSDGSVISPAAEPRPDRVSIASTERKKAQTAVVSYDSLFVILACCHGDAAASQTNSYTLSYVHMSTFDVKLIGC